MKVILLQISLVTANLCFADDEFRFNDGSKQCEDHDGAVGQNQGLTECGFLGSLDRSEWALTDRSLRRMEISTCEISLSYFKNVNFSNSQLRDCHVFKTSFLNTNFQDAELIGAEFKETNLENVTFLKSTVFKSLFEKSKLNKVSFQGAQLRGSEFNHSHLHLVDFRGADLRGVKFQNTIAKQCAFIGAKYDGTTKLPFNSLVAKLRGMIFIK